MYGTNPRKRLLKGVALAGALVAVTVASPALAEHVSSSDPSLGAGSARLVIPMMNPNKGMNLFVNKGCVSCHAINGVGGEDGPAMDAHRDMGSINPFDFAAKMWNHAPAMIAAQEDAFGEQIYFTGEELANIIAFLHDPEAQHDFSEESLSEKAKKKMMEHDADGAGEHGEDEEDEKEGGHGAEKKVDG